MPGKEEAFWRRKLIAFLHDSPDKCFDIGRHEENAETFMSGAGIADAEERRSLSKSIEACDHFAAAADRFVFPQKKCSTNYNGQKGSSFIHPLSSTAYITPEDLVDQAGHLHEILHSAVGGIESESWHVKFFLYWRRWLENAATSDKQNAAHLAFSPADSRIPDHTIWNHMAVTSALAGCIEGDKAKPAMLLFQFAPVQEFIAQARSTRDLWSGSYLLSWLIAHAMKAITDEIGPDSIIFPSLRGNGIFDALHRDSMYATLWKDKDGGKASTWDRMLKEKGANGIRWLLTPTLPNRFLALVPESQAERLAKLAVEAIEVELKEIGDAVWGWLEREAKEQGCSGVENWKERWDSQIKAFPQITWAVQPWLDREASLSEFKKLPVNDVTRKDKDGKSVYTPIQRLEDMLKLAEEWMPVEDRDRRYYTDDSKTRLNNPGVLWSAHYAILDAKLAARRNTRDFSAWDDPAKSKNGTPKDSLSGKEECIGDEKLWAHLAEKYKKLFPSTHCYGAMNLIKRLWCRSEKVSYLPEKLGIDIRTKDFEKELGFDSVQEIACKNNAGSNKKDENGEDLPKNPYVAVLAMDGDDMGKWVSGEKTPEFLKQVSKKAAEYLKPILEKHGKAGLRRLLTPSYHLQFSEALANFSVCLADPIVKKFDGQLIYSGGDDVLAMLPADKAIACAEALRAVFRGEEPEDHSKFKLHVKQAGYVSENMGYPLVVPGKAADVSIGLAIGHSKAPLQMLVREAQRAEKIAKKVYGKGAIAISLYKRSGEIIEWGCKWDSPKTENGAIDSCVALTLMRELTRLSPRNENKEDSPLSGRFPYALAGLLKPYKLQGLKPDMMDIIRKEFEHVLFQQGANLPPEERGALFELGKKWLCQTKDSLEDFANLFLVETFINRPRGEA